MKYRKFFPIIIVILLFNLMTACNQASTSTPAKVATKISIMVTPTRTEKPTSTPSPTVTPDVAATQQYADFFSQVEEFKDQGYFPDTKGSYVRLQDFNQSWAQLGWFSWWDQDFDINITNFVVAAHFSWESASDVSENSGCGIVFALQDDEKNYSVFLAKSRIYFTRSDSNYYYELGKTKGTGRVQFGNPAEADFSLVVFETHAYAFVDKNFIGEYSLSGEQPLKGKLAYSLLSGTNKDYGTRCKITNSQLWVLTP
jgi:hypothetical protein